MSGRCDPPVGEATGEDLDRHEHLLGRRAAVVAVLVAAVAEPVVGGHDHPSTAVQHPWAGDLDLAVAGRGVARPPALAAARQLAAAGSRRRAARARDRR